MKIYVWVVGGKFGLKNTHKKGMYLEEIGLRVQDILG